MAEIVTPKDITFALLETRGGIRLASERTTLASGRKSLLYFNVGDLIISYPDKIDLVADAMTQTWRGLGIQSDRLIAVPEGVNILAGSIRDRIRIGQLRVRETQTGHGDQKAIEGVYDEGMTVAVFEDVMSTGGSTEKRSIQPVKEAGLVPNVVVTLIDREYGGIPKMKNLGLSVAAFMTTSMVAEILITDGGLPDDKLRLLQEELEEMRAAKSNTSAN